MCGSGGPAVGCGIAGEGLAMARGMGGMGGVGDGTPCKLIMEGMRGGRGGGACSGDRAGTLLLPSVPIAGTAAPTARQAQRFTSLRLHLGDAFAGVFDHPRPIGNGCARINAASVNRRRAVLNPARDGRAPTRGFTQFCFQVRSGTGPARSDNPVLGETRHTRRTSCAATPKQKTAASKPPRYDAALFLPLRHRQHARLGHTSLTEGAADRGQMRAF